MITRIAAAVTTLRRDTQTAEEHGEAVARECIPLFKALGMTDEGDGWGFSDDTAPLRAGVGVSATPISASAAEIEKLKAEVERLRKEANGEFVEAAVRVMQANPGFEARDYSDDGITADDFERFFTEDMNEAWEQVEQLQKENGNLRQALADAARAGGRGGVTTEMQRLLTTAREALVGGKAGKAERALESLQDVFDQSSPPADEACAAVQAARDEKD